MLGFTPLHRHLERGESLLSRMFYARALQDFEQALRHAKTPVLRMKTAKLAALCLIMTGEEKRAFGLLRRETTRIPEVIPDLARQLAESMGDLPSIETLAEHYLQQVLRQYPGSDSTRIALLHFAAAKAHRLKQPLEAVPHYEEFLER